MVNPLDSQKPRRRVINRQEELSKNEIGIYNMLDTLQNVKRFQQINTVKTKFTLIARTNANVFHEAIHLIQKYKISFLRF